MRTLKFRARWRDTGKVVSDFMEEYTIDALNDDTFISEQFTGLLDKNGKEIYELMEINNKYKVIYKAPNYVLNDISSGDILTFKEIIKNENEIEITKEYTEL